jgi:hypothetical protein
MTKSDGGLDILDGYCMNFLAESSVVYHCHHYNLALDQTIDDALGAEKGTELRTKAAHEAFYYLLKAAMEANQVRTPQERFRLASDMFAAMGHGNVQVLANAWGGQASSKSCHYGHAWKEKYGKQIKKLHPADAVAAGFSAAATELAYDLPLHSLSSKETECIALNNEQCTFQLSEGSTLTALDPVTKDDAASIVGPTMTGKHEEEIEAIANGLREFLKTVKADDRGLVQGFGVFVTLHLASYYNQISYGAWDHISELMPQSVGVMEDLLREAGHVCAFNTFGGIISSPEWEGLVGPHSGDIVETIIYCCAIGRALGFGHWTIEEAVADKHFVIRTPSSYESNYYRKHYGIADASKCFLLQGGILASVQLAHRVDWKNKPELSPEFYAELFRGGVPWRAEETSCLSAGADYCEVVVEAV